MICWLTWTSKLVSHVGDHSLYDSAYHGVPVVAFPNLCCGQISTIAKKNEHFGLGVALDHHTVNAQELFEVIVLVVNEPRY